MTKRILWECPKLKLGVIKPHFLASSNRDKPDKLDVINIDENERDFKKKGDSCEELEPDDDDDQQSRVVRKV